MGVIASGVLLAACQDVPPDGHIRATESVWCADATGEIDTVTWAGHDGDLTAVDVRGVPLSRGQVTEDELIDACSRPLRGLASDTLCETYARPAALEALAHEGPVTAVHGELGGQRPGFPVVVRGAVDCSELTLHVDDSADPVADRLRGWESTEAFNQRLEAEREFRAAADGSFLDVDQAREIALTAAADLPGGWPIMESTRGAGDELHAGLCFDVRFDRDGVIRVGYHHMETPHGRR